MNKKSKESEVIIIVDNSNFGFQLMDEIEKASELNRKETNKPQVFYAVDATVFLDQVD